MILSWTKIASHRNKYDESKMRGDHVKMWKTIIEIIIEHLKNENSKIFTLCATDQKNTGVTHMRRGAVLTAFTNSIEISD